MDIYTNLHSHTYHSVLDAINSPEDTARLAKSFGMTALAITDHGTLNGIPEFVVACKEVGIKPVLGIEAYMVPDRTKHSVLTAPNGKELRRGYHIVLLAKNLKGYQNLVKLYNIATTEGFYYVPKIDWEVLTKYREGIICTSACISSELAQNALGGDPKAVAKRFKNIFEDDYYIELMDNSMVGDLQRSLNGRFIALGKSLGIKCIPTCDTHYLTEENRDVHDVALCIRNKKLLSDATRQGYDGNYHLKSPVEMAKLFPDFIKNTLEITDKIENYEIFGDSIQIPTVVNADDVVKMLATHKLSTMGLDTPEYNKRLELELAVITKKNFAPYFLTTKEIIDIIREAKCPIGWGRGSSAGSLICYLLSITDIDPIKYGLLFERFINESREDYPDIDIDIPQGRRQEILDKIVSRYGHDKVAHIITSQRLKPKSIIRDVARVMDINQRKIIPICNMISHEVNNYEDLVNTPILGVIVKELGVHSDLMINCLKYLSGNPRHIGLHASGIVISSSPIANNLPIAEDEGRYVVQYDMDYISRFGFLKFDILGLRTLDIIFGAAVDAGVDIKQMPLDDNNTYQLIGDGRVRGVFQIDGSYEYINLCKQMKPVNIKEIFDLVSLHRPGMTDSGQDVEYLRRRAGELPITYSVPEMEQVLKDNYGVCIFQEDMMRLVQIYAGFTPVEAENLRRAISKKNAEAIAGMKDRFMEGAKALNRMKLDEVWNTIEATARYSWNKSHCLTGDTMISTPKGDVAISQIKPGDVIHSVDQKNNILEQAVKANHNNGVRPTFKLCLSDGKSVKATGDHRFLTDKGYKSVNQFKVGDNIKVLQDRIGNRITEVRVESITPCGDKPVWDLEMPTHHNFIANGIVSHNSVVYGMVTYACAYLSANYPVQFFKNLLNYAVEADKPTYLSEILTRDIKLLPPDVNRSDKIATVEGVAIRMGLNAMKGVGEATAMKIFNKRPFNSMIDISSTVNKAILAILHAAGALNNIPGHELYRPIDKLEETDILGISLGGLAAEYKDIVEHIHATPIGSIKQNGVIVAKVMDIKERTDKYEREMAFLRLIDVHGARIDGALVFSNAYKDMKPILVKNGVYGMVVAKANEAWQIKAINPIENIRKEIITNATGINC